LLPVTKARLLIIFFPGPRNVKADHRFLHGPHVPKGSLKDEIMPGRQLNLSIRGEQYEKAFDAIASHFLSVVRVPRPDDYGIDVYCHILRPLDPISSTVGGTFAVQVRGPGCNLRFGGMDRKNVAWKGYEIEWLRSLAVPLYLGRLSADCTRIDFYSLWPLWLVLGGSPAPFQIICEFDDPSNTPFILPEATKEPNGSHGDGMIWTVALGPPFLSVTQEQLRDETFIPSASILLSTWVELDRITVIKLLLRISHFVGMNEWSTNDFDFTKPRQTKSWMAWSQVPGQNIDDICRVFEPVITNLGTHLQHQDDTAAYRLIPALEWLQSTGRYSPFSEGLLKGLIATEARGESPRPKA
jgi:hypothetical protein